MTTDERRAAVRTMAAAGDSNRAIAAALGVDEKTVRTDRAAESAPSQPASAAPEPHRQSGYTPPEERGPLPLLIVDGISHGVVPSPDGAYTRCPCGHIGWRMSAGSTIYECGCPPKQCHGPRQVADADGTPQIVWGTYCFSPFPGLPPAG